MTLSNQMSIKLLLSINELTEFEKKGRNIYIYGNGGAGRWAWKALSSLGIRPSAFVDTDIKKLTVNYGFHTISVQEAESKITKSDILVIGAVDIHEILTIKDQTGLKNVPWTSLGDLTTLLMANPDVEHPSAFEKYSVDVVLACHHRLLNPKDLFLRSVDIVITEKCSLKCQDCANLMQYYTKPKDGSVADIIASVDWLMDVTDGVFEFRLIGGEPFMNKEIYQIIERLLQIKGFQKLVIYTNGMIPLKEKYKSLLLDQKVIFSITDYGDLAKNTSRFVQQVSDWGCVYRVHPPEHWTDSGRIKKQNRSDANNQKIFNECCGKNLWTLSDKGFGRCPFALNAAHLGAIEFTDSSVVEFGESKELKSYLTNESFLSVCDLCNGRSFSSEEIAPAIQTKIPLKMLLI